MLAKVVPHGETASRTQPALQTGEELGAPRFVATALADELVLERVGGVDIRPRERRRRRMLRREVGVDPLEVHVDVVNHGSALRTL